MAAPVADAPGRFPLRRLLPLVAVALFAVVVALFAVGLTMDPRKLPSALLDKPAPEFDLPPLTDTNPGFKTADLKGQVSLVNFFASWCVPCRVEHPVLMRLAREGKVAVHGIAWKDGKKNASDFLAELGNPYRRIGFDPNNKAGIDFGVYGVPETYVVDRDGRIRYKVVGPLGPDELNERVLPLIEKLAK